MRVGGGVRVAAATLRTVNMGDSSGIAVLIDGAGAAALPDEVINVLPGAGRVAARWAKPAAWWRRRPTRAGQRVGDGSGLSPRERRRGRVHVAHHEHGRRQRDGADDDRADRRRGLFQQMLG